MKTTIHRTGLILLAENEEERALLNTLSAAQRYEFVPLMARRSKRLNLVAVYPSKESWKSGVIFGQKHAIRARRQGALKELREHGGCVTPKDFPKGFQKLKAGDRLRKGDVYSPSGKTLVPTCACGERIGPGDATYYRPNR